MKSKCPCCDNYTLSKEANGNYEICPVCYWENDPIAYDNPYDNCNCNNISLIDARSNYIKFGACSEDMKPYTRPPFPNEKNNMKIKENRDHV